MQAYMSIPSVCLEVVKTIPVFFHGIHYCSLGPNKRDSPSVGVTGMVGEEEKKSLFPSQVHSTDCSLHPLKFEATCVCVCEYARSASGSK